MVTENFSPALRRPASPRPCPQPIPTSRYGKRPAGPQRPPRADDFTLLPERERYIAEHIDRQPEHAAIDAKSLAKCLAPYGQMAVRTALRALGVAGHLRHVGCRAVGDGGQVRWVTLTFWSRAARDNEWWDAFLAAEECRRAAPEALAAEVPAPALAPAPGPDVAPDAAPFAAADAAPFAAAAQEADAAPDAVPDAAPAEAAESIPGPATAVVALVPQQRAPRPAPEPAPGGPSPAYLALARLGRIDARLALSAADCTLLERLAAEWLARGVDSGYLTHALTAGLPARVDTPVGFVRRRLNDKMPPRLPAAPAPAAPGVPVHRLMVECTECGTPGRSEALPDGLCRACRQPGPDTAPADGPPVERDIRAHISHLRDLLKAP